MIWLAWSLAVAFMVMAFLWRRLAMEMMDEAQDCRDGWHRALDLRRELIDAQVEKRLAERQTEDIDGSSK